MKKTVVVLALLLSAILLLSGCGRMVSKAIEKATEKAIEKDSGAKVDISDDGDSISVQSEDGSQMQAGGDVKWPDKAPSDVPKLEKVKYSLATTEKDKSFMVGFEEADSKTIENYLKQLLDAGFVEASKMESEDGIVNSYTKDKITVSITYTNSDKTGLLMIALQE